MSESNPATLREALTAIIADLRRREKRNLNSAHASLRGFAEAAGYAADQWRKLRLWRRAAPKLRPVSAANAGPTRNLAEFARISA
jgi:hypothetical protein